MDRLVRRHGRQPRRHRHPGAEVTQLGECGASQRLRGYSVVTADDLPAALALAKGCPGLADPGFGVEVGVVEEPR